MDWFERDSSVGEDPLLHKSSAQGWPPKIVLETLSLSHPRSEDGPLHWGVEIRETLQRTAGH